MLRTLFCIGLIVLAGCSTPISGAGAPVENPGKKTGNWFCEMHTDGETWVCVQDEELADNPQPSRLPEPKPKPDQANAVEPVPRFDAELPRSPPPQLAAPVVTESPPATSPPPAEPEKTAQPQPTRLPSDTPKHVRLAYRPEQPVGLMELPADLYAVQLVALNSRDELEAYVRDNRLRGMSAARVEANGTIFFVLLLGIYESAAIAAEASTGIPPPLDELTPWVRRLGSLQQAMLRADELAGGSRY